MYTNWKHTNTRVLSLTPSEDYTYYVRIAKNLLLVGGIAKREKEFILPPENRSESMLSRQENV